MCPGSGVRGFSLATGVGISPNAAMNGWSRMGKILAVCSSLALGVGYVACRQAWQAAPAAAAGNPQVMPSSKNPVQVVVLPSSKNIDAVFNHVNRADIENIVPRRGSAPSDELPQLLPGSKLGTILRPDDFVTPRGGGAQPDEPGGVEEE